MQNDVGVILKRMVELLGVGGVDDWAVALESVRLSFDEDPVGMSLKLISMYGGMGSLNDVVLYRDRKVLVAENNEFDSLRTRLYEVCKGIK
ncbi:hypothetical protein LNN38_07610 [Pseudomonas sp. LA21]|uniref:DUF6966 domain-containing protein n=1 Tax=unclassified Pseudomonas TaxID=196821 RepID=UPI001FB6E582|nr:hypothetical protein [Pseudomonas sp. LA21]MCJ1884710.1 hypothetical protein [Pseudomonas sp. LA21]